MNISILRADYENLIHQQAIPFLLNEYANDPQGGAEPLSDSVLNSLVPELAKRPFAFSVLAFVDKKPAGLVNCFEGFSTFACKPLVNIHDVCVKKNYRGLGISIKMLELVTQIATERGCCKLTLEVLSNNSIAKSAYQKVGFVAYELAKESGSAEFWQKRI